MTSRRTETTSSLRVRAAGQTAKGRSRRDSEDCYAVLCGGRLVVLADGTAGRPLGGIASWTAVEEVRRYAREQRWDQLGDVARDGALDGAHA